MPSRRHGRAATAVLSSVRRERYWRHHPVRETSGGRSWQRPGPAWPSRGLIDASIPESLGPDTDPADAPPEVQELMGYLPHVALGMLQAFTVTAESTEPGPLPGEVEA